MEKIKMAAGTVGKVVKSNKENLVMAGVAGAIGAAVGTMAQLTKVKKGFKTMNMRSEERRVGKECRL